MVSLILINHDEYVWHFKVADHPLNCMKVDDTGTLICVGAADGSVLAFSLSSNLPFLVLVLAADGSVLVTVIRIILFLFRSASLIQLDNSLASCSKLDRTNANDMFDRQDVSDEDNDERWIEKL